MLMAAKKSQHLKRKVVEASVLGSHNFAIVTESSFKLIFKQAGYTLIEPMPLLTIKNYE